MTFSSIWEVVTKIIDISLVWFMFYYLLKNLKNNVKLVLIFKGIVIIGTIKHLYIEKHPNLLPNPPIPAE